MCLAIVPSKDSRPKGGGPTTDNEKRIIKEWDALDSNQYKQCGGRSKTDTSCLVRRNCKSDGCPVQMKYVRGNRTLCRCQYGERNDTLPIIVKPSTSGGTRARRSTTATTSRSRDQPAMANRREANHRSNMPTTRPRNAVTGRGVNALSALSLVVTDEMRTVALALAHRHLAVPKLQPHAQQLGCLRVVIPPNLEAVVRLMAKHLLALPKL